MPHFATEPLAPATRRLDTDCKPILSCARSMPTSARPMWSLGSACRSGHHHRRREAGPGTALH
jgi:hypothetical protein